MHKYNWKGKKFLPEKGYLKNVRKITITIIFLYAKKEKIYPAYVSKHNSNCKKHYFFNDSKRRIMALSCRKIYQRC